MIVPKAFELHVILILFFVGATICIIIHLKMFQKYLKKCDT